MHAQNSTNCMLLGVKNICKAFLLLKCGGLSKPQIVEAPSTLRIQSF